MGTLKITAITKKGNMKEKEHLNLNQVMNGNLNRILVEHIIENTYVYSSSSDMIKRI